MNHKKKDFYLEIQERFLRVGTFERVSLVENSRPIVTETTRKRRSQFFVRSKIKNNIERENFKTYNER